MKKLMLFALLGATVGSAWGSTITIPSGSIVRLLDNSKASSDSRFALNNAVQIINPSKYNSPAKISFEPGNITQLNTTTYLVDKDTKIVSYITPRKDEHELEVPFPVFGYTNEFKVDEAGMSATVPNSAIENQVILLPVKED